MFGREISPSRIYLQIKNKEESVMSANNYSPILTKGLESELTTYTEGLLRFTTDTHRLFLDTGSSSRIEFTDFVKDYTKAQILALTTGILPKIYIASDTHELFAYNTTSSTWEQIGYVPKTNTDAFYGVCSTAAATAASHHFSIVELSSYHINR